MRRAYAGLLLALSACDPTRGLTDTADAALPTVKRYFDGPGSQVASGPWSRVVVDLDVDTLYHLGGRRLDDKHPTFHLFGADARDGCEVTPNAGTWLMGKPDSAPFRLLPFLESMDERGRGRMRFTTLDCKVQDIVVEDAGRPYPRIYEHGYLVPTKQGYTFVDPWSGSSREIAENLQSVLLWQESVLFWADDQLKSFSDQFEVGSTWGNELQAVVPIKDDFLAEDADGLHHVVFDRDSLALSSTDVLPGACHVQRSNIISSDEKGGWVVMEVPCGNPKPTLVHLDGTTFEMLDDSFPLPFEADASHARALVAGVTEDGPRPLAALYLTDVGDDGFGTLWAWQAGSDAPIELGEHGDLDTVFLDQATSDWNGVAQVNYQTLGGYQAHDWIHFRWNGETETIAERIVRNALSGEVLVDFDGIAGDLVLFTTDGYVAIAKGVPPFSGQATSYTGGLHRARIHQFDGVSGELLLGTDAELPLYWDALGAAVPPDLLRFSWFMPALVFIENWDAKNGTGSLVAYNYELDARTTIAEGVSSFDLTSYPWDGVVYSIPRGNKQGIWFSKAK